jgi:hypothetical protein
MSKRIFFLALVMVLLAPCVTMAQEAPRYTYVEVGYIDFDPEGGLSDDGGYGEGSLSIFKNFHLLAEYDAIGDYTLWNAGGGWHGLLGEKADLFAEILWNDVEFDTGATNVSDNGYEVAGGARWNLFSWLELKGQVNYLDLDKGGDDTTFEGEAMVSIFKGKLGIGANVEVGDTDTLKVFGRFTFGRK